MVCDFYGMARFLNSMLEMNVPEEIFVLGGAILVTS